jgi:hypothetical protein|tara:strand:+ start:543 stop:1229 length:687 start_codon:yes stop_codon:yes gene_type:complete
MRNTDLYFGLTAAATQSFANITAQSFQLTTGGFNNPLPVNNTNIVGDDFTKNGLVKVTITSHATNTTWGTHYTTANGYDTSTGGIVEIHPNALSSHATNGTITVATAAADTVYGWTKSGTGANNDVVVTQLKPYAPAHGIMYNSGKLVGTAVSGGATTALNFVDNAGVLAATDTITITHAASKQKEFIEDLMDVVADDNRVTGMVVVRDDMRLLSLPTTRGTVIASVA